MELSGIDYDKWFRKIQDLLGNDKKNIKNILELGCGTGNITQRLLEYGYEVVGVDISGEMLSIAKEKLGDFSDKVIFMQQDVCDFDFDIYEIDMILAVNDLINYITDDSDLKLYLSTWYLTKAKQEFFIAYFKSHDEQSEFKRCLGSHWMLARSMPFIAQGKVQWLRMKAFQLSPILYTYLIVHVQPLIRRLLGKSTENLKVG